MRMYTQNGRCHGYSVAVRVRTSSFSPLILNIPPTKSHSFIGWFFAARARARGSDFCEKLTFRENFSQKNFFKKFSNFPKNHLTNLLTYGIIKKNQGGNPMCNNTALILALNMYKDGMLTDKEISKVLKNFSKKFEKLLDKSNQK